MITSLPKQCPFCDGDIVSVKIDDVPNDDGFPVCVTCNSCGARGPVIVTADMDSNETVDRWNTRPTEDRLSKMVLDTERRFRYNK